MSKNNINSWITYSLLIVFSILLIGAAYVFYQVKYVEQVSEVTSEQQDLITKKDNLPVAEEKSVEEQFFPKLELMTIASTSVKASLAITWADRIKGLSDSPYLPEGVVKFFVFDVSGTHSIWMKDMKYSIDIIWVNENNKIVDIKENASPESYPDIFSPREKAMYVIEAAAGFVEKNKISVGSEITLPKF